MFVGLGILKQCFTNLHLHEIHPRGRTKVQFESEGLGISLRFCISIILPGGLDAASPQTAL